MGLKAELPAAKTPKLLVVGEVVLDRYLWGTVDRISPEAPIPVLRLNRSEDRLGNAAFVAASVRELGAEARLFSVIGADTDGRAICRIASELAIGCDSLLIEPGRPTIVKERLLGAVQSAERGVQQLLRVDREGPRPLDARTEAQLLERVAEEVAAADGVLVCDINKGLLTRRLLSEIIRSARSQNKPVIVDPCRTDDFSIYHGATALTPNRFETQHATGLSLAEASNWPVAARKLVDEFDLSASLVTLDRDGMFLAEDSGTAMHIEAAPKEIHDVTGAGDVVLAVFGFFWTAGWLATDAAMVANLAASLELSRQGATVISRAELANALGTAYRGSGRKILPLDELRGELDRHRKVGSKIAFIDGSFDALHAGHVGLLEFAQSQADVLVVGLKNGEDSVAQPNHRIQPKCWAADRARMLAALPAVDYIVTFDDPGAAEIVHTVQPDVFIVTDENCPVRAAESSDLVRRYGGRVVRASAMGTVAGAVTATDGHSNGGDLADDALAEAAALFRLPDFSIR